MRDDCNKSYGLKSEVLAGILGVEHGLFEVIQCSTAALQKTKLNEVFQGLDEFIASVSGNPVPTFLQFNQFRAGY